MTLITAENAPVLQSLFTDVARDKPQIGDGARVTFGKHTGKVGTITRHALSRFKHPFRYGNDLTHIMTEARGRHYYIIRLKTDADEFWVDADKIMLCKGGLA